MKRTIIIVLTVLLIAGCRVQEEKSEGTSNGKLSIDVLGTDKDGYTIKRFSDGGYARYYVTPGPARTITGYTTGGKNSQTHYDDVETK